MTLFARATAAAIAALLSGCAAPALRPEGRCVRWRIVLEPRVAVTVRPERQPEPSASITARRACAAYAPETPDA